MGVALVDLGARSKHDFAAGGLNFSVGWNLHVTQYSASLVKIAAMFAAFRLRENVRAAAATSKAKDSDELFAQITADWKPIVERSVPGGRRDFPQLDRIFSAGGGAGGFSIDFDGRFRDSMADMIGPSDNAAASRCILALGYQYIQGALAAEGLYTSDKGGLWLAGDYSSGRDGTPEPKSRKHQAASAAAVARFLTLLETNRLVSADACSEMRSLMTNDYMIRFLDADGRTTSSHYGKLGIGGKSSGYSRHDCAVIERSIAGKTIRYAAIMLGAKNFDVLADLGIALDNAMLTANGLPLP
jgi:hypothetical protein